MASCQCDYYVNIYYPNGDLIIQGYSTFYRLDFAQSENVPGSFEIIIEGKLQRQYNIDKDYIFEFWKAGPSGYILAAETIWFATKIVMEQNDSIEFCTISGHDALGLLDRRIVAWPETTSPIAGQDDGGYKTQPSDVMIIDVFDENFHTGAIGPGIPPSVSSAKIIDWSGQHVNGVADASNFRNLAAIMNLNAAVLPHTTTIAMDCAWKNVLSLMQEISNAAQSLYKERVLFDFVYTPSGSATIGSLEFRVFNDIRGQVSNVELSAERGTLNNPKVTKDYTTEIGYVFVGGGDVGGAKIVAGVLDFETYEVRSPWTSKEVFVDYPTDSGGNVNSVDVSALENYGANYIFQNRARARIEGSVVQTPDSQFGTHYKYGDLIQASAFGYTEQAFVSSYHVTVENGQETIEIPLNVELLPIKIGSVVLTPVISFPGIHNNP